MNDFHLSSSLRNQITQRVARDFETRLKQAEQDVDQLFRRKLSYRSSNLVSSLRMTANEIVSLFRNRKIELQVSEAEAIVREYLDREKK